MSTNKRLTLINVQNLLKDIGLTLRPHQIEGIETILTWYEQNHGGILADEMGLGKTCQSIIALAILSSAGKSPALVICPLSVIDHWENEIARFSCGQLKSLRYYGSKEKREELRKKELKKMEWNVLLTTFEVFLSDCNLLKFYWEILVFDEAHRIKNADSLMHQSISMSLPSIRCFLMMTGTPIQNNLKELYALLKLADNSKFPDDQAHEFLRKYADIKNQKVEAEFRFIFQKYCLRRSKKILPDVPAASEVILYHGITRFQKDMYKAILRNNQNFFVRNTSMPITSMQSLMNTLIQLRKCVVHPYLFKGIEKQPYIEGEHIVNYSGKMLILDRLLKHLHDKGHKVLIFSQMSKLLDIVYDYMEFRGYVVEMLDGKTKSEDRLVAVENFQRAASDVFCFLLTTKAGGIGLNLTAADTVLFLDWDFNPQNDKQAAARCHRIGQSKPVKIIRLVAKHTVDEIIKYRASHKLKLSELVLDEENDVKTASSDAFAELLLEGLKELEDEKAATMTMTRAITDKQLEQIIGKTDMEGKWVIEVNKENIEDFNDLELERDLLNAKAIYNFEGKDYFETRQVFDRILLQKNETGVHNYSGEEDVLDESIINKILGVQCEAVKKKQRKFLTDEEKESRKKQRKEIEIKKRKQQELDKIQKKENLWKKHNYSTCNLELYTPQIATHSEGKSECYIYNVLGDVTNPGRSAKDKDDHAIIIHTVNDSGRFGFGGVFSALRKLSPRIADTYELAGKMKDLNLGDSHLLENLFEQQTVAYKFKGEEDTDVLGGKIERKVSVVLMVVQSARDCYQKMISKDALEKSLQRIASFSLGRSAKSIHLPMFWFGVQNIDEDVVRSMLTKCICKYKIFVYIYRFAKGPNRITSRQKVDTQPMIKSSPSALPLPAKRPRMKDYACENAEYESSDEEFELEENGFEKYFTDDEESETSSVAETSDDNDDQTASTSKKRKGFGKRHQFS